MPSQILSDAKKQAVDLAKQVGMEALKTPGEIAKEAARAVGLSPQEVKDLYGVTDQKPDGGQNQQSQPGQNLEATRAKLTSFAAKRAREWQSTETRATQQQVQRVDQIVKDNLGLAQPGQLSKKEEEKKKKGGVLDGLKDFFKGKQPKGMGVMGLGQAKKQASGEFNKGQQ